MSSAATLLSVHVQGHLSHLPQSHTCRLCNVVGRAFCVPRRENDIMSMTSLQFESRFRTLLHSEGGALLHFNGPAAALVHLHQQSGAQWELKV